MAKITNSIVYRDFDFRFLAHPITGKLSLRTNAEAIKQALKCLILTNLYERPYLPSFGSRVKMSLFDNYTAFTESDIRYAIQTAVKNYENRIELLDIRFGGNPDKNELEISIFFRPINTTTVEALTVNLERTR